MLEIQAGGAVDDSEPLPTRGLTEQDLAALYPAWYPRLYRYFAANGCHEALAHELTQESFAAALRGLPGFRGDAKLSTWLWAIAQNVLRGHWRRKQALDRTSDTDIPLDELMSFEAPHLNEAGDCVRRGFARFAQEHPERAQTIYLAYVEGWSRAELAQHLGRSEHACTVYLAECKARLQPFLQDCHDC